MKSFTAWDYIQMQLNRQKQNELPTKMEFGRLMHGDLEEDEKKKIAEKVLMAGGYDALED